MISSAALLKSDKFPERDCAGDNSGDSPMAEVDPLKPGKIAGQNPNTPERLQGEMNVDADRVPNSTARLYPLVVIPQRSS